MPVRGERPARRAAVRVSPGRALFILDAHTFAAMREGEPPAVPYSHDRNVLLLAHVALGRGMEVAVCCGPEAARAGQARVVSAVYPRWAFAATPAAAGPCQMVACAGIEGLVLRDVFPAAKLVGMLPALHMFEAPGLHPPRVAHDFIRALRDQVDFVVTQNSRMRETLAFLCHWLARWEPGERIIVAPLGLSRAMEGAFNINSPAARATRAAARARLGLAPSDVLVVNAGGTWNWTDCDTFVEAACQHAQAGGRTRVYLSGLAQPDNPEPNQVRDRILALMREYPDCFAQQVGDARAITIERDWAQGGRDICHFLRAGDLGLSVNKPGFEGWQSHRVRVLDYLGAGLPLLCAGDDLLAQAFCDPRLRAQPGSVESYRDVLRALEDGRLADLRTLRRDTTRRARAALDGDESYGAALDHILATPRRDAAEIAALPPGFLDRIEAQSDARLREEVRGRLGELLGL